MRSMYIVKDMLSFTPYFCLTNDRYIYDNPVHLVPELDGLRIVGHYSHEFLQRVPGIEINYTVSRLQQTPGCNEQISLRQNH